MKGAVIGSILLAGTCIFLVIQIFVVRRAISANGRFGKRGLTLNETSDVYDIKLESGLIGTAGVCLTSLRPCGYVLVNGQKHEVISNCGLIVKDTIILVEHARGRCLYIGTAKKE